MDDEVNVVISIPSGRPSWNTSFAMSLIPMVMRVFQEPPSKPFGFGLNLMMSSTLQMSREDLVHKALAGGATHILFLDDDHTFPPDTLHRLLRAGHPIVCANYVKRQVPAIPVSRHLDNSICYTRRESKGLEEVRYAGLGVSLIQADVFRGMPEPWFDVEWGYDPKQQAWTIHKSEDVYFFDKCREHGYPVLIDHDLSKEVTHVGEFQYSWHHGLPAGEMMALLEGRR